MASDDVSPCLFIALSTVIDLATWAKNKPPAVFKKEKKTPADRNSAYLCIYIFFRLDRFKILFPKWKLRWWHMMEKKKERKRKGGTSWA